MKSITVKHNTSTVAILDKWLVVENEVILATFSSRQSARDSKLGKVYSLSEVNVEVFEENAKKQSVERQYVKSLIEKPVEVAAAHLKATYMNDGKFNEDFKVGKYLTECQEKGIRISTARHAFYQVRDGHR